MVLGHRVKTCAVSGLRGLLLVAGQIRSRSRGVRSTRSRSRRVRVASIERLHGGGVRLQRRQRLRERRTGLQLVGRYRRGRWVCLTRRSRVYTIGGVV